MNYKDWFYYEKSIRSVYPLCACVILSDFKRVIVKSRESMVYLGEPQKAPLEAWKEAYYYLFSKKNSTVWKTSDKLNPVEEFVSGKRSESLKEFYETRRSR